MSNHRTKCLRAVKSVFTNRKRSVSSAFKSKERRTLEVLGAVKSASVILGYGFYSILGDDLRHYRVDDEVDDVSDG